MSAHAIASTPSASLAVPITAASPASAEVAGRARDTAAAAASPAADRGAPQRRREAGGGSRLRTCTCGAECLGRRERKFCSRDCAHRARQRNAVAIRPVERNEAIVLRLLKIQPLERRVRGGWRFGTKAIGESLAARLIASGRAEIAGNRLRLRAGNIEGDLA